MKKKVNPRITRAIAVYQAAIKATPKADGNRTQSQRRGDELARLDTAIRGLSSDTLRLLVSEQAIDAANPKNKDEPGWSLPDTLANLRRVVRQASLDNSKYLRHRLPDTDKRRLLLTCCDVYWNETGKRPTVGEDTPFMEWLSHDVSKTITVSRRTIDGAVREYRGLIPECDECDES